MINKILLSHRFSFFLTFQRSISYSQVKYSRRAGFLNHLEMLTAEKEYISRTKEFIPQLTSKLHKGQCGRIGIFGGSLEYTGAPYFAAISALKLGADLVHVFCCKSAATTIKSYSPELIVHPLLDDINGFQKITPWLDRLHAIVIGPGLGRDEDILDLVGRIITHCRNAPRNPKLPLIIDADGLYLITQSIKLISGYPGPVILTPNAIEYSRLCERNCIEPEDIVDVANYANSVIVKKGDPDVICNGFADRLGLLKDSVIINCRKEGSVRRCGGQGDILSGVMSVFTAWFFLHKYSGPSSVDFSLCDVVNIGELSIEQKMGIYQDRFEGFSLAAYSACAVTKYCSNLAYQKYGRSMTASDMIPFIHEAFENYFEK